MNLVVLDANVAAKWHLPAEQEPNGEEAFQLLRSYGRGAIRIVVPDLFWAELGNVLWKAARRGRITKAAARSALDDLQARRLPTVSSLTVLDLAFSIATAFDRTVYDSLYVALAVDSKAQFITADERLANALAAHLPVKWLGAL